MHNFACVHVSVCTILHVWAHVQECDYICMHVHVGAQGECQELYWIILSYLVRSALSVKPKAH